MARSTLRQVLNYFEGSHTALRLSTLAKELDISEAMLAEMIQYWVKKGKLREVNLDGGNCTQCHIESSCPFVVTMPRMYELVREGETTVTPSCCCGK